MIDLRFPTALQIVLGIQIAEDVPCQCVASANIVQFFERLAGEAEGLVLQMLANRTVADSVSEIRKLEMARLSGYAVSRTARNA
jgi:hypothetical protein